MTRIEGHVVPSPSNMAIVMGSKGSVIENQPLSEREKKGVGIRNKS